MRRHPTWLAVVLACLGLAACGEDTPRPTDDDLSCDAQPDPLCDNPINEILIPELRALGITPTEAEPRELCRRMAIDLIGRIPTPGELTDCLGESPAEMVERFMDNPESAAEYETVQRRRWAKQLGYRVGETIYWQVLELDELVGELVSGDLRYDDFAALAIVHPGFFASRLDGSWGAGVFNVFLGRPPRRDEMDRVAPLSRQLQGRTMCDGRLAEGLYENCLAEVADGAREGPCVREICPVIHIEGAFFPCGCSLFEESETFANTGPSFGCIGDGLGQPVDLGVDACYEPELNRMMDYTAGDGSSCADLSEECADYAYLFGAENIDVAEPLPAAPEGEIANLGQVGDALVARSDFWEAAVDQELSLLLGWWRAGFRQPDFDLPAVRQLLAAELREHGDLREVQRTILTSLLYTAPAVPELSDESVEPADLPPWSMGPVKLLTGERWLGSASLVVGEVLGMCDHRFIDANPDAAEGIGYLSGQADYRESTLDFTELLFGLGLEGEQLEQAYAILYQLTRYAPLARDLGGCLADPPPRSPSLSQIANEADAASLLCALGRDAVPRGISRSDVSDDALGTIADHLVERALGRAAETEERETLIAEMRACLDESSCDNAETASRWLCARLLDSTLFAAY